MQKKDKLSLSIISIILIGFALFYIHINQKDKLIIANGNSTIAKVIGIIGNDAVYIYNVNDVEYKTRKNFSNELFTSEKLYVKYNVDDPSYSLIIYNKHIIDDVENFDSVQIEKLRVSEYNLSYDYKVKDRLYHRSLESNRNWKKINQKDNYVIYKKSNPKISYISGPNIIYLKE
ncbi:hypothetical protein [Flammeovirga sp. EKP202]|uniref:hypothetical protein n=1 Tax=Flammeovirga sp. EKP202 TaxID=2770592 RepID=UPI00165EC3D6|nr:hypothetical protein [Flammeovirga sp. EKP202]MBD0402862.1 hypothetical protein [Flammeovirga sp. EKP202]